MMKRNNEHGQALILLVLGFVVLLGFTALAIDGGMIYSDRRLAQNAADAAALAGAGKAAYELKTQFDESVSYEKWNCESDIMRDIEEMARNTAIYAASENGFAIEGDPEPFQESFDYVRAECHPDKSIVITTTITMSTDTSFMHFVYKGDATNTVTAVTKVWGLTPVLANACLISLNQDTACTSDKGTVFDGNQSVYLEGCGAHSETCIVTAGTGGVVSATHDLEYIEEWIDPGNKTVIPTPSITTNSVFNDIIIDDEIGFRCPTTALTAELNGDWNEPGYYEDGIKVTNGQTLNLNPGLYCMGDEFVANGGVVFGEDVTIYMKSGKFSASGNTQVTLKPPLADCDDPICPPAVAGMLIYFPESNCEPVAINGTSDSYYGGTIYAPCSQIDIGGTSNVGPVTTTLTDTIVTLGIQAIGDIVKVHGDVTMTIQYNGSGLYNFPASAQLEE